MWYYWHIRLHKRNAKEEFYMTLKMDRSHVCKLSTACLAVAQMLENEANDPNTSADRKEIALRSAKMWHDLREEVREQIAAWDEKHKPKD